MIDSLDYTPAQALHDASAAAQRQDYDGAILILLKDDDGSDIEMTHFISGVTASRMVSHLEVLKTKFALQLIGIGPPQDG